MAFPGQRGRAEVRMRWGAGVLVLGLGWDAVAQQPQGIAPVAANTPALAAEAMGSVVGHVYLADTGGPARLAEVGLQPVEVVSPVEVKIGRGNDAGRRPQTAYRMYRTGLDGGYRIEHVLPGSYYVVVKEPGYLSPFAMFTKAQLAHPTAEDQQKIAEFLPEVTVAPNNTANLDIHLTRGASLSGTVSFDDGEPYPANRVTVMAKDAKGKWQALMLGNDAVPDDQGHFRITGLLAGDYLLKVNLAIDDTYVSSLLGRGNWTSSNTHYSLAFYSGDTARMSEAKPIHLESGQAMDAVDITIPVSKLHAVSGAIVEAKTGRAINSGTVTLYYTDGDKEEAASANVEVDEPVFRMPFVPEGSYAIKVTKAADVSREEVPNPPGAFPLPPFSVKQTVLQKYGTAEQALVVAGDVSGVDLAVTPVAKTR